MPLWLWIILGGLFGGWSVLRLLGAERQQRLDAMRSEWEAKVAARAALVREARLIQELNSVRH